MYNKIKGELYATDCECFEIKFFTRPIGCCVLAVKCSKNDHLNLEECTRQLTRMITNALWLCCSKLNPTCLHYDSKPAKRPKARWAIQLLNHLRWTAKSGKLTSLSRAIKRNGIHLEVLSLQNRISFDYFLCFHRTLGIFPRDLEGYKADIAFIYTTLACSLTI